MFPFSSQVRDLFPVPRVWIGCLACYNHGELVGHWYTLEDAGESTVDDVHRGHDVSSDAHQHEELWCFDHENVPVTSEFSPLDAAEWATVHAEVGEQRWDALCAWVRSGSYVAEGTGDMPSVSVFDDAYLGAWDSFRDYAEDLANDIGILNGVSPEVARYFDWGSWTSDLRLDYLVEDAAGGGVHVFAAV